MTRCDKNTECRRLLALRIRELRKHKALWAPGTLRRNGQCRRGLEIKVLTALAAPCTLADLLEHATKAGHTDLANLQVDVETVQELFEDGPVENIVLTVEAKASDAGYAEQIAQVWKLHQAAAG